MKQYIVDAFTDTLFKGNQAAVCVMDQWISDDLMREIAVENRFSETAFAVKEKQDAKTAVPSYHLRWFTPGGEIDFCGHATLGTSYVLFHFYEPTAKKIAFRTQVGELMVERQGDTFVMDFPAYRCSPVPVTRAMEEAIGAKVEEAYLDRDLLLVLPSPEDVVSLTPDQQKLQNLDGLVTAVTARGKQYDCVSRVFAPKLDVEEDPVTGSTHCMITPYWCDKLKKNHLNCFQASERTGVLYTTLCGERVKIAGKAVLYSSGEILSGQSF